MTMSSHRTIISRNTGDARNAASGHWAARLNSSPLKCWPLIASFAIAFERYHLARFGCPPFCAGREFRSAMFP